MSDEHKRIAQAVENGAYFEQARDWFKAVYLGPIHERTFFLIIAVMSGAVLLISLMALSALSPIAERQELIVRSHPQYYEFTPKLVRVKEADEPLNPKMAEFLAGRYVMAREAYSFGSYRPNAMFVRAHSNEEVYRGYLAAVDPANPQSPLVALGEHGQRHVVVQSASGQVAHGRYVVRVRFSTELTGIEAPEKSQWTADLEFTYKQMEVTEFKDPETGQASLTVTDPDFQVTSYAVKPVK
jgi:type IV secretory pathway component VirB8